MDKRKTITFGLIAMMFLVSITLITVNKEQPNTASAEAVTLPYTYTILRDNTCTVSLADKSITKCYLSPQVEIDGKKYWVTEVSANGFSAAPNLQYVYMPSTVKTIGVSAFMNCQSLKIVSMPAVETIGANAFMRTKITDMVIPETVENIGANFLRLTTTNIHVRSNSEKDGWDVNWKNEIKAL